jgi:hypothetical protein
MLHYPRSLLLACLLLAAGIAAEPAPAQPEPTESQATAKKLLLDMAGLLGAAQAYQVDLQIGYDSVQPGGEKIEFGEHRSVALQRPSHVLNELLSSDGRRETILFDGSWITVSEAKAGVYARAPQPGDIDVTLRYFLEDLGMRLPLAAMMMSTFPDVLGQRLTAVEYVEKTSILGPAAHHLAGSVPGVDFQVWIAADGKALPLRIILTYRDEIGQPQFRADFSNWNFAPEFASGTFAFVPPAGAREIPLVTTFTPATPTEEQP